MQWNIENLVMVTIKHSEMNQISALNATVGVPMLFNKTN